MIHNIKVRINNDTFKRLEAFHNHLSEKPLNKAIHPAGIHLSYSIRVAIFMGLLEEPAFTKTQAPAVNHKISFSIGQDLMDMLDSQAEQFDLKRADIIRLSLDAGLPKAGV